ncbi:acyl-CoA dehydrogenase family protein [Sporomusa sp. KB1]|jgi:alkylation response protein AidB-like acyl-CoA dehydrogenase|uniref:acyl-CoA dehydrogenase family protein n=1 Tax=Sporomusa sp. KB1 TaxID=943346 RepID=UPI00119D880C|nr:acyl-CoA dehydrogenase family protein [Sporomusa sp. KB1]TWH46743.1 alkylation response protein AidB-like acyl-CoA dehydrogenase [Sporomusa sp. KB1]
MTIMLSEEQQLIRNIAREFAVNEIRPQIKEIDGMEEVHAKLNARIGELGFRGIMLPEEWGGLGQNLTTQVLVAEEIAKESVIMSIWAGNPMATTILKAGTAGQKEKYLRRLVTGEFSMGFGFTEPTAGSDASNIQTTAVKDGDEWVINGTKIFITGCLHRDAYLVSALTNETAPGGISAFIVERDFPGFSSGACYKKLGIHGSETGELYLKNCRVPAENMMGAENKGLHVVFHALDMGRVKAAAVALGNAVGAFEEAVTYAQQRVQFGKPISKLQTIQHYTADMLAEIEVTRAMVYHAAALADANQPFAREASIAKMWATEMGSRVTDRALQICGGYGLTEDSGMERRYRDARVLRIIEGTTEIQKMIIARTIFPK